MRDAYGSFRELAAFEREGEDWVRDYRPRGSRILVMAPHGGWIEPYTDELARCVAGDDLSLYTFRGLAEGRHRSGRKALHITSHRFDEPLARRAVGEAEWVLALHGERSRDRPFVMLGGLWREGGKALRSALEEAGFEVLEPRWGLRGEDPRNICNCGRSGVGGQMEISEGLRRMLREEEEARSRFAEAVRRVLLPFEGAAIDL